MRDPVRLIALLLATLCWPTAPAAALNPDQLLDRAGPAVVTVRAFAGGASVGAGSGVVLPSGRIGAGCRQVDTAGAWRIGQDGHSTAAVLVATFKDRYILVRDPHLLIEGIIICCYAIKSHAAYIYIRGEYTTQVKALQAAIDEAYAAGYLGESVGGRDFKLDVTVHRGAGAYVCGEETALLESIEGRKGQPRSKPPFPAVEGLYGCPTIINNVQSIASLPFILTNGPDAYKAYGTEKSPGTHLFGISGLVKKPGMYELPLGLPILEVIDKVAGGLRDGRTLKGIIPGGSSTPVLTPEEAQDVTLDYESMAAHKTMFGSGGIVVLDDTVDMVKLVENLISFYHHESCGQCTPCREGLGWMLKIVKKILRGEGTTADIDLLTELCDNIEGKTVCVLSAACTMSTRSYLNKFRHEFEAYVHSGAPVQAAM